MRSEIPRLEEYEPRKSGARSSEPLTRAFKESVTTSMDGTDRTSTKTANCKVAETYQICHMILAYYACLRD
jgi:hypothetical protein